MRSIKREGIIVLICSILMTLISCELAYCSTNINYSNPFPDTGIEEGTDFQIRGTITSDGEITGLKAYVTSNGSRVSDIYSIALSSSIFDLSNINSVINIGKLEPGEYALNIDMGIRYGPLSVGMYNSTKKFKVIECTHDYEQIYEATHPHQLYYKCKKCGNEYKGERYSIVKDCYYCNKELKKIQETTVKAEKKSGYIHVEWKEQINAESYFIYRSQSGVNFEKLATTKSTEYDDYSIKYDETYYYYVIGYNDYNVSAKSNIAVVEMRRTPNADKIIEGVGKIKIEGLKATKRGSGVTLTWKKSISNYKIDGFLIFQADNKNGPYNYCSTVTEAFFSTEKPVKGQKQYYFIQGYRVVDGETYKTNNSNTITVDSTENMNVVLDRPVIKATAKSGAKIQLKWGKIENATRYQIYIYDSAKKKFVLQKTNSSNNTTAIHKGLRSGRIYKYKIRAYCVVKGKRVYSPYSAVKTVKAK